MYERRVSHSWCDFMSYAASSKIQNESGESFTHWPDNTPTRPNKFDGRNERREKRFLLISVDIWSEI